MLLRPGERLLFGRDPHVVVPQASRTGSTLLVPDCAPHVSRLVGELAVGTERAVLSWLEAGTAQLAG
jgi:hypothetical protein